MACSAAVLCPRSLLYSSVQSAGPTVTQSNASQSTVPNISKPTSAAVKCLLALFHFASFSAAGTDFDTHIRMSSSVHSLKANRSSTQLGITPTACHHWRMSLPKNTFAALRCSWFFSGSHSEQPPQLLRLHFSLQRWTTGGGIGRLSATEAEYRQLRNSSAAQTLRCSPALHQKATT